MDIIINNSSMEPIYEQIVGQIKSMILDGKLAEETVLPSVRALSKDLKISALTVKKHMTAWSRKALSSLCMERAALLPRTIRTFCRRSREKMWKQNWKRRYPQADTAV